jgi:choice-of-anchor B domain-containing protein
MKASLSSIFLAALATTSVAEKINTSQFDAQFLEATNAPNAISMSVVRERKVSLREQQKADGVFDVDRYEATGATSCTDGKAGEYSCGNIDLKGFLRHQDMGSRTREGNDVWGWTSSTGREFALLGQTDGTAFAEVHPDGSLTYVGRLPTQTVASVWRDIKVIGNHAYIGSEAPDHGLQIFDLTKLLTADPENPPTFSTRNDLKAHFTGFGSSHNIVANEDTDLIIAVGTETRLKCRGGLWMIDVSNPARPQDAGCVSSDGYTHDAQCVIYKGPMTAYQGREICFNYNEDALTIVNINRRTMPAQLSRTTYNGATYTHQGWVTEDHKYLLLDDELDEQEKTGPAEDQHTTTYIVDISDLTYPVFRGVYKSPQKSIDHNQYIIDGLSYQANYGSGLRIVNVTTINEDDTGALFEEAAFFDIHPEDDEVGGTAEFFGAWSVYPYFASGNILVSSIERGLYSLRHNAKPSCRRRRRRDF